jgi:hypothetical protein
MTAKKITGKQVNQIQQGQHDNQEKGDFHT